MRHMDSDLMCPPGFQNAFYKSICFKTLQNLMRGPVVYCAEEVDNGKNLHLIHILPQEPIQEGNVEIQGKRYPALLVKGEKMIVEETGEDGMIRKNGESLYRKYQPPKYEDVQVTLIPYFAWANRGENEMMVWMEGR